MTVPAPATDRDILADLAPLLAQAYEHSGEVIPPGHIRGHFSDPAWDAKAYLPDDLVQRIRWRMADARRLGLTVRQIASRARVPGEQVIRWIDDPKERAEALNAEVNHLERGAAQARRRRAQEVYRLRHTDTATGRQGMTKVALADMYGVSRPTIDQWLEDAVKPQYPHSHD